MSDRLSDEGAALSDEEPENITPIARARARDRVSASGAEPETSTADAPREADEPREPRLWAAADLAAEISRRASEPWIPLEIGGGKLVTVPLGESVVLVGPTGSGKSSLALAMAVAHARSYGPAMYVSCEMPPTFVGGRVIGQAIDRAWPDVLRGEVDTPAMIEAIPNRFYVVERKDARAWRTAARAAAAQHPSEPLAVIIDYLQILPTFSESRDMRARITEAVDDISEWAIDARALVIVLSQTSRAAARALRAGEAVGWSATDAGAESAAIERAAHVVLAIGERGSDREDGSYEITLSIGKHRMGSGDQVVQAAYHGASGRWSMLGMLRRADVVKTERDAARDDRKINTAAAAVFNELAKARSPMSRSDLRCAIGMANAPTRAAIARLVADGTIVEIESGSARASKLWTPERAREAKLAIVGDPVETGEPDLSRPDGAEP